MDTLSIAQLAWITGLGWAGMVAFCAIGNARDKMRRARRITQQSEEDTK